MNLILFGFKRCGKTTYGKLLAKELNRPFIDTDDLIEARCENRPCRDIFLEKGEAFFRALEKEVISSLHAHDSIISVGGGAVLDPENCAALKKLGTLVYLEASKETLKARQLAALPAYLDGPDSFDKMYQLRKPLYEKIDAIRINTEGKKEQDVINELKRIIYG